ncbi:MAG: VTT domain-containing protein [Magnetococcales bacterium]|nr:VTT domain-containing protein [Magnetococcales bacterium]
MAMRLLVACLLAVAASMALYYRDSLNPAQLESWVQGWGTAGMITFVGLYAVATILFLPGSVLTLAAGALFGPWLGGGLSLLGATTGAAIAFLLARYLAGAWIAQKAQGMMARLLAGVESEGWRFVAFVRLVPLFPFNLLNYALGLTRIRFDHYVLTSLLCMAPGGLAYSWLGYAGREAASGSTEAVRTALWALGLLTMALLIPRWLKQQRQSKRQLDTVGLQHRLAEKEPITVLDVRDATDFVGDNGHVPGSINIPLPELENRLDEILNIKGAVAVICHTDKRSATAFRRLDALGVGPLFLVRGGMKQWRQDGFPVER